MRRPITTHVWWIAPDDDARIRSDPGSVRIDAHRNRRGPFTAAGGLIRAVARDAIHAAPDLVASHLVTLLAVAPELRKLLDVPADVRQAVSVSREGDPPAWGRRMSNGVADFVIGYFDRARLQGKITMFDVDQADPADLDVIAVLLRRVDPGIVLFTICTRSDRLPPSLAALEKSVVRRTDVRIVSALSAGPAEQTLDDSLAALSPVERQALAQDYVDSDGASCHLLARYALSRLPAPARKAMHLARADWLNNLDEPSLLLGAIPYHHEQAGEAAEALVTASNRCIEMACYDAALDWSRRGRTMLSGAPQGKAYDDVTRNLLFALLLLGHYGDVVRLCDEVLSGCEAPALQAHACYAMAILNARLYERSRHDYDAARSWVEKAQAFMWRVPVSPRRIVNDAFFLNTLALVEMRQGQSAVAEQKLTEAIALLARSAPEFYSTQSVILLHNRAHLHLSTGRADLALEDLSTLLSQLPSDAEAWLDRSRIHQRAGRHAASLADCDMAIRWEPAHVQAHFHRAVVLVALDRIDDALAAYGRVIELQPDAVDALLNRAVLLRDRGEVSLARNDVDDALRYRPTDARALCLRGLIEMRAGHHEAAFETFTQSIAADPSLADPLANRAAIAVKRGDLEAAVTDLTQALALREDAGILGNRAKVFEKQRQWQSAANDYTRALALGGGDSDAIARGRARCIAALREVQSHGLP